MLLFCAVLPFKTEMVISDGRYNLWDWTILMSLVSGDYDRFLKQSLDFDYKWLRNVMILNTRIMTCCCISQIAICDSLAISMNYRELHNLEVYIKPGFRCVWDIFHIDYNQCTASIQCTFKLAHKEFMDHPTLPPWLQTTPRFCSVILWLNFESMLSS